MHLLSVVWKHKSRVSYNIGNTVQYHKAINKNQLKWANCVFVFQGVSERDVHVPRPHGRPLAVPLPSDRGVHQGVQRGGRRLHLAAPAGLLALHDRLLLAAAAGGGAASGVVAQRAAPAAPAARAAPPQVTPSPPPSNRLTPDPNPRRQGFVEVTYLVRGT